MMQIIFLIKRRFAESKIKSRNSVLRGFTLLELLVSVTILSLMMVFIFSLIGQTIATWEIGNRRIEAAQAARVGLNMIARDLQYAFSGNVTVVGPNPSGNIINILPFFSSTNATTLSDNSGRIIAVNNSDQIFAISSHGDLSTTNTPFQEIGYQCVFVQSTGGNVSIAGQSYALVKHRVENLTSGNSTATSKFNGFLRNNPTTNWIVAASGDWINQRQPVIDNCIRFKLSYMTEVSGNVRFRTTWGNQTALPRGVLAEVTVMDSRTAARIRRLKGSTLLSEQELSSITNLSSPPATPVERILREGSVTMSRLIPFLNSQAAP